MKIRLANMDDIDHIYKLGTNTQYFCVSKDTVGFWPKHLLEHSIDSGDVFIFIIQDEDEIGGFMLINYNKTLKKAIIENIFLLPKYRGTGASAQLLKSAINHLKHFGCEYICTLLDMTNEHAINFYLKNGFTKGIDCAWLDLPLSDDYTGD